MTTGILVVGGNGFVGSAVCRAAVRRGWKVQSISKTGKPFTTPNGHSPAWAKRVEWISASAFEPATYRAFLTSKTAVVHTLGTLFDGGEYKRSIKSNNPLDAVAAGVKSVLSGFNDSSPLSKGSPGSYESVNRDSALLVCETFLAQMNSAMDAPNLPPKSRAFVYISAEDVFRPAIPTRYITTKRQAERSIQEMCDASHPRMRSVFIRPSFIYHPHFRPISSPIATLLSVAGGVHQTLGNASPLNALSRFMSPTDSQHVQNDDASDSSINSIARAMSIPPIHVDHVGEAVCESIQKTDVEGPVGVWKMRQMLGWTEGSQAGDRFAKV